MISGWRPGLTAVTLAMGLLSSGQATAQPNLFENVSGNGFDAAGGFVDFLAFDLFEEQSVVSITLTDVDGNVVFSCGIDGEPSDVVHASGKRATIDLDEVFADCEGAPAIGQIECVSNGEFEVHFVGNTTTIIQGERFKTHGNSFQADADCLITLDTTVIEGTGSIFRSVDR